MHVYMTLSYLVASFPFCLEFQATFFLVLGSLCALLRTLSFGFRNVFTLSQINGLDIVEEYLFVLAPLPVFSAFLVSPDLLCKSFSILLYISFLMVNSLHHPRCSPELFLA